VGCTLYAKFELGPGDFELKSLLYRLKAVLVSLKLSRLPDALSIAGRSCVDLQPEPKGLRVAV
jgi:hypothetical protein